MPITSYTIADLRRALDEDTLWSQDVLPITKHKALSQVRNPRAEPEDVALLVAYQDDRIIGYIGMLSDATRLESTPRKLSWVTTWWVDPEQSNRGVGGILFLKALQACDGKVALFGPPSTSAKRVLDALKRFVPLRDITGRTFVIRFVGSESLKSVPGIRFVPALLKILDAIVNSFVWCRFLFWKRAHRLRDRIAIEYVSEIDREARAFIDRHRERELTSRDVDDLNWIIKHPWVISAPLEEGTKGRYEFSSVARHFFFLNIKLFDADGKMTGFVMLRVRDNDLAVPYVYTADGRLGDVLRVIGHHLVRLNIRTFTVYREDLLEGFAAMGFPTLYRRERPRPISISKTLQEMDATGCRLQDGDGEGAFV